jgi:preprotein translocase subunit SecE
VCVRVARTYMEVARGEGAGGMPAKQKRQPGLVMAKVSPLKFMQEVRAEVQKVTWPSRRETAITTLMVFIMAAIAGVFFLIADQLIRLVVTAVLQIGS